jgi:cell division protein FtsI/penicillin-binding protein 2
MSSFTQQAKRRTLFVMTSLGVLAFALVLRIIYLQAFAHDTLQEEAERRLSADVTLHARRGRIYDQLGRPLAVNKKGYVLWLDARHFNGENNPDAIFLLTELAEIKERKDVRKILKGDLEDFDGQFFFLWTRWIESIQLEQLQKLMSDPEDPLGGLILEVEPRRTYPYGSLLAPVLGYLQPSGSPDANEPTAYVAYNGVEAYYNQWLQGVDGEITMEQDQQSFMIPIGPYEKIPPQDGANLTLTLDLNIQYMAERFLLDAIDGADARRGDILVVDPRDGSILAMVSYPSFDPSDISGCAEDPVCSEAMYTNAIYGRQYEPGSTFKILTMAIALEEHVVQPDSSFECTGIAVVGDQSIRNWNGQSHGHETMTEILLHSCNIGAVHLSQKVGPDAFYRYTDRLGFGRPTGVDLSGEISGTIRSPEGVGWALSDLAANAYGQAIAVTPLQLATAVSAVANGGELYQPRIVKAIGFGGAVTETLPILRGRVFHEGVCRDVTDMLVQIGELKGENSTPVVPGYKVAVKTGTAQIPGPDGRYEPHRTIASAIGYAPADDPRFLILVRIEGNSIIWGEGTATPVLGKLARFILSYLQVPPSEEVVGGP